MGRAEENALKDALGLIKSTWLHRKGNEIPAAVIDTIEALYGTKELKPIIVKKTKQENGWFFVLHLPPGASYHDFKKRENFFQDSAGGAVHISKRGKAVYMEVMTNELGTIYPFKDWDPKKYEDMYLPLPVGVSPRGEITVDLIELPHVFICGETNYGKSNMIHVFILSLLLNRDAYIIVLDFKMAEFAYLEDHVLLIDDIPRARVALMLLNKILDRRLKQMKQTRVRKVQSYLKKGLGMQLITLVVDELAEMQDPECQAGIERLARLGRSAGINIIAATQRPSSTLYNKFGDIKAMFPCRICFLVADQVNSNMILDSDRAALLPAIKGRAIYKWGIDMLEVQAYFVDPDEEAPALLEGVTGQTREVNHFDDLKSGPKRLPPR